MLLLVLIAGLWSAGLLLVAGLCAAARRGDRASVPPLAPERDATEPDATTMPARIRGAAAAAARIAA